MGVARLLINWLGCKSRHEVHNSISSLFLLCVYHPHTMIHVCIQVSTHHIISHQMLTDFHNQLVELSYYIQWRSKESCHFEKMAVARRRR